MGEYDDGSGKSKWGLALKITGLGCAVLILVGGILSGLGVFKAVSCCSEVMELAEVGNLASEQGYHFARALHEGDQAGAEALVDPSRRDLLEEAFRTYGEELGQSLPFPVEYAVDPALEREGLREFSRWYVETLFAGAQAEEGLGLRIEVEARRENEEVEVRITNWRFSRESRDLTDNVWTRRVRNFGEQVRRERGLNEIRFLVHFEGPLGNLSEEEFQERVRPLREVTMETRPRVHSILPVGPFAVEVIERYETLDGSEVREVAYLLTGNQQIEDFIIGGVVEASPDRQEGTLDDDREAPPRELEIEQEVGDSPEEGGEE